MENATRKIDYQIIGPRSVLAAMLANLASPPGILEHAVSTAGSIHQALSKSWVRLHEVPWTDYELERGFINRKVNM